MTEDVYWHVASIITRQAHQEKNKHKNFALWFTGLSGSGKSILVNAIEKELFDMNYNVTGLDGDNVRHGLCSDLGFTEEDLNENMCRTGKVATFTGVSASYEYPIKPDMVINLSRLSAEEGITETIVNVKAKKLISS